ncbi:MAG TPA: alpha-glucan family phosphorylase [Sedimenticola sp.]|nr:alpha-glucan family phosphorylase [Sedimenticola sp.]
MSGTVFNVEVRPRLPERIRRLEELANDLYYSWDRGSRRLLAHLDPETWVSCNSSPKLFLRRVAQSTLNAAASDPVFLAEYGRVLSVYDTYMQERPLVSSEFHLDPQKDLVAYFSLEFGLHQSMPIYAGGLGILAGDYCKAMSNLWMPFLGVGLLYREGYFTQRILCNGDQQEEYPHVDPEDLPIQRALDADGNELQVQVEMHGRQVHLLVWEAKIGHIHLYLLDSDTPANTPEDRGITYKLYGGGSEERIRQEITLGIGGVRALRAMGRAPTVWHINEGHASFLILERIREKMLNGTAYDEALVTVASNTVFTTHTPVPAGHDIFGHDLILGYFTSFLSEAGIETGRFLELGNSPSSPHGFNMTALGMRGSAFHNGVSRIHGRVASEMESHIWPQIPPDENPITYVTNGVDAETFLGQPWVALFEMYTGRGWRAKLTDHGFWRHFIDEMPEHAYRSVREIQKAELLEDACQRARVQFHRNGANATQIEEFTQLLDPKHLETLVIGFARRFATYKRATLLFRDLERLARLVNDPQRPVLFLFAGKAHPNDEPGKQLIREIMSISQRPEFRGKVLLLEDYNLSMARKLYPGVDVWLNVPEYPKEACGTSGMKAAINGALNVSVLDGWWDEAYNGGNGWAITPSEEQDPAERDRKEALELLNILEHEVIPLYFSDKREWTLRSKEAMKSILPHFNSIRMAHDYIQSLYLPARNHGVRMRESEGAGARTLADWMQRFRSGWTGVRIRLETELSPAIRSDEPYPIEVALELNDLDPADVVVECVLGRSDSLKRFQPEKPLRFLHDRVNEQGEHIFRINLNAGHGRLPLTGLQQFQIRVYPSHPLLSHPFVCGCMIWL